MNQTQPLERPNWLATVTDEGAPFGLAGSGTTQGDCVMNPMTWAIWIIASGIFPIGTLGETGRGDWRVNGWRWLCFVGGEKRLAMS